MSFLTEQLKLRLYVLTRHKAGAATEDIIGEMVQVHGKSNVPQNKAWIRKGAKRPTVVKPKLTTRKTVTGWFHLLPSKILYYSPR